MFCAGSGYTTREDFTLIVGKSLKRFNIFVIDILKSGSGKFALLYLALSFFLGAMDS
jgi:hypothetical protein